ncbi:TPA: hypothetical protein DEB72_00750, partial [Patescibacteria group bacterium]|nr:hypothetical protein [Patescibacteria group bacterium]
MASQNYQTNYTYDRLQNLLTIANPDNSQVKYTYNTAGQLEAVSRKEAADAGFTSVVTDFDYGPHGQITYQGNFNGATTTNPYDAAKLYRLQKRTTANSSGTKLQDLTYTYDANGNITRLVDASQTNAAKTVDYTYDGLNRLLTATATAAANGQNYTFVYSYDSLGNILTRTETVGAGAPTSYTYFYSNFGYANPHAVTSINDGATTITFTYDANGNLISQDTKTYTWDYHNQLAQVDTPGQGTTPIVVSFYPSAGDGSVYYYKSDSWDTTHNAITGSSANYTNATWLVNSAKIISTGKKVSLSPGEVRLAARSGGGGSSSIKYKIERGFIPFDTSALPNDAFITEVKLKLFVDAKLNNDNDGADWVTVVQGFEPNTASLSTADYDLAGSVNSPVEGVDVTQRKDITGVATGQYLTFNLNTTGRSWVLTNGYTKLAVREGHDVLNIP